MMVQSAESPDDLLGSFGASEMVKTPCRVVAKLCQCTNVRLRSSPFHLFIFALVKWKGAKERERKSGRERESAREMETEREREREGAKAREREREGGG